MSIDTTWQIKSHSSDETELFGEALAALLHGGEVIELRSDLGGGKTTLVRGLVRSLGSVDHVSSPTFTISKEYRAGHLRIIHFDFYRLVDPAYVKEALAEAMLDTDTICLIEWAGLINDVLPADRIIVDIGRMATGEDDRTIAVTASASLLRALSDEHAKRLEK